jgi:Na+/melibiose symporter-like transporter
MSSTDKDFGRNFSMGVVNGALFNASAAFLSGTTILPVFISQLTKSRVLIGLFSTIDGFGWFFPQLFAALFIAHRGRVLGFYNNLSFLRLGFFGAAIAGIFIFSGSQGILVSFGVNYALLSLAAGFAGAAFTEIVGKTIPVNKRGSYFGLRMFIGGAAAALEGLIIKRVISGYSFPFNFGYMFIAAWVLMLMGLATFGFVREPETIDTIEKATPGRQFKSALLIFKKDENFRRLFWSRAAVNTYYLSSPFYVVFAINRLGASSSIAGVYLTAQMIGYLSSNILWAWLSNHVSNKKVIAVAGLVTFLPPLISLIVAFFPIHPLAFALVFFLFGSAEAGIGMGYVNYLLEITPEKGRLLSIGLMHTLIAPTVFCSVLGGFLSQIFSIKLLFFAVCLTTLSSYFISIKLNEPRIKLGVELMPETIIE